MKLYIAHVMFKALGLSGDKIIFDVPKMLKQQGVVALCPVFLTLEDLIKYQGEETSYTTVEVDEKKFVKYIT